MTKIYKKMNVFFYETATCLTVDLSSMRVENWMYDETMSTDYKTADECLLKFEDNEGTLHTYRGYVPDFFPDKHYGDYIMLTIEKSGIIRDLKISDEQIIELLASSR